MPKKNTMDDLRDHLFETLEALKDETRPMDIDRALAVATVADKIIATAKVEVDFVKATNDTGEFTFVGKALAAGQPESPQTPTLQLAAGQKVRR